MQISIKQYLGSAQKLIGILSAKCPVFLGLLRTVYAKLFLYDPLSFIRLNTNAHQFPWLILPVLFLSGCAGTTPRLNRSLLPQTYHLESTPWTNVAESQPGIYFTILNQQKPRNQRVLSNWKVGAFHEAFHREQPLSSLYREDIANLSSFLNRLFTIYLVGIDSENPLPSRQLRAIIKKRFSCEPLSNLEIRFLMNSNSLTPFSRKPMTMLLISSHELALLSGAKPIYPTVFSPYLRNRLNLPPIARLEDINLFATKNENRVYSTSMNGFVVCNRESKNQQLNP